MAVVLLPTGPEPTPPEPPYGPRPGEGVRLADVERALGQRVGPFADLMVQQGLAPAQFQVEALRSSAETAGWENLFVLRRGVYAPAAGTTPPPPGVPAGVLPGDPIPGFNARDRTRLVKAFMPESGSVEVDRDYLTVPVAGEALELHVLHPEWELRPAVLAGLERVFRYDRIPAVPALDPLLPPPDPPLPVGPLTTYYPWLTDRSMVWAVEWGPSTATGAPAVSNPYGVVGQPLRGWDALQGAGGVFLQLPYGNRGAASPTTIWVGVRRPGWSLVNLAEWQPGHIWHDFDLLSVPLPYAAAAAHVEAWDVARIRLLPGAVAGMARSENDCGRELTRQTVRWFRPDVRPPEDRYPVASRLTLPGGRSGPHWGSHTRSAGGGASGWIANA